MTFRAVAEPISAQGWKILAPRWGVGWLVVPAAAFILVFFFVPLAVMVERSLFDPSPANYLKFFESAVYPRALMFTLWMAGLVTALCLLLGFPYAYLTYRLAGKWQWLLIVLVLLPFWSSLLVRTYAWTILLRDSGLINWSLLNLGLIERPLKLMGNSLGIVIGMTHVLLPFMVLPLIAAMRRFDENLHLAASGLGASPLVAFWRVFVPLCMPGVLAGCLLVFVLAVGFYITPAILGGRTAFFSLLIVMQVNKLLDFGFGSALGVVLLAVVLIAIALGSRVVRLESMFDQGRG
ncbi:ABC transporter permease [Rhodoligotrophos defluvii]|uniref:ABC transporter permease n=1 Tax=Rhodoligotrophos defluvii TaxID=2561934 RepID=UPI00195FC3A3|nr:ABC transporter permease [Rhodoligotrophos defluvii]